MRRHTTERFTLFLLLIGVVLLTSPMVYAQPEVIHDRAMIRPSLVHMKPGETVQFRAAMVATRLMGARSPETVEWSVNDILGGNQNYGTIDNQGYYTAPDQIPTPREVHICGHVEEASNRYLYATVILGDGLPTYRSVGLWTEKVGDPDTQLRSPHGIDLDKEGNLLIADERASRVFRYTRDGEFIGEIGEGSGKQPGQFNTPREVRVDEDGYIFVSDSKGDKPRIQVFTHEGEFLRMFAEKGRGSGQILRCHGLAFDPEGRLFLNDVDNMRVNVYTHSGKFLYMFSEGLAYENMNHGELNAPHGISVDPSGDVFVNSYYGPTQKFTPEGAVLFDFAHGDPPDGPIYFHNHTIDRWGNVYLLVRTLGGDQGAIESGGKKKISVMKYNNNGDFITSWSFSNPRHSETTAVVDEDGLVYALFRGEKEMGVEIFKEEE